MTRFSWSPLVMVVVLAASGSVRIQATPATVAECPAGFGSETMVRLLPSQINDGYCDCPTTGQDEPKTQACSGQDAWPGQPYEPDSTKRCVKTVVDSPPFLVASLYFDSHNVLSHFSVCW